MSRISVDVFLPNCMCCEGILKGRDADRLSWFTSGVIKGDQWRTREWFWVCFKCIAKRKRGETGRELARRLHPNFKSVSGLGSRKSYRRKKTQRAQRKTVDEMGEES